MTVLDADLEGRHGGGGRTVPDPAAAQVEFGAVPRADHAIAAGQLTFVQRSALVGAGGAGGQHLAAVAEQQHTLLLALDVELGAGELALGQVGQRHNWLEVGHRR